MNQKNLIAWWTLAMVLIAVALPAYLTVYVWRRVDRPQVREGHELVPHSTEDYAYFYAAAKAMREGEDIYTVEAPGRGRAGYLYPPMIAFLYQPLAKLDLIAGARVSLLIDEMALIAALAIVARALVDRFGSERPWQVVLTVAVLAALLSSDRIKGEMQMLQTNGLVALGLALGLWMLDRRPWLAGLALGFAINIKYQALGLLLYLIFRRRWKGAGWTAAGAAFWALLPALSVGLARDGQYLLKSCAGVLRMMGINAGDGVANVEPLTGGFSLSITSAAARLVERTGIHASPYVLAGTVALAWLFVLAILYWKRRMPALVWPAEAAQKALPWSRMAAVEWMAVIGSVLAFSPETNSRQMLQTALLNALGVVLVMEARGRMRWLAVAGLAVMWMGLNLPPGNRAASTAAVGFWHGIGGPAWCVLAAAGLFAWVGLDVAGGRRAPAARE